MEGTKVMVLLKELVMLDYYAWQMEIVLVSEIL